MKFFRLYLRVLELLGPEARLGWALALAGVALAAAAFVEPILFGRIVDALANAQGGSRQLDWNVLLPLVGAWVGFGLFIIVASTIVSLHADRLAHRHCQAVRADYFEHILQLPLSYHTGTHSGRLMKVMITGTNTLWGMWLSFFREHFTSFISLFILMPLTLFLNWRYGLILMLLCGIFAALIAFVLRRTENLQSSVETYYTDQAERTSDTLGNIALIQSFARIDMEVNGDAQGRHPVARRADAGAVVVGAGDRADQGLDHHHHAGDPDRRHLLLRPRPDHRRRNRDVHELRHHADRQARAGRALRQSHGDGRTAAAGILRRCSTRFPPCATAPTRSIPAACAG